MTVKYIVINEHTLAYHQADGTVDVLASKPQHGGWNWMNGPFLLSSLEVTRPATLKDFEYFRVSPKGHLV